jgi:hypothetical protein
MFWRSLFILFIFGYFIVCHTSIYSFWLPLGFFKLILLWKKPTQNIFHLKILNSKISKQTSKSKKPDKMLTDILEYNNFYIDWYLTPTLAIFQLYCGVIICIYPFLIHYILIDWVWGNSKFIVPETLTIDRGEAEVNSQGRGEKKLAIPEYTVYKYFIIPKNIRLIVEWSPQNDKE